MLKLGSLNINKAYLGGTEINKMYLGNTVVFDKSTEAIMLLSYNATTSLNLAVATRSGDDWEIDWGDGVWEQYASSNSTYRTKTFGSATAGVARVRSATGKELHELYWVQSNVGTWSFNVADLYVTYWAHFEGDLMALTGDVGDIKASTYAHFQGDLMTFTGDVGDVVTTLYTHFQGASMELTYTTKTWTHIPTSTFLLDLATGHLTTEELSQMLIDMDASGITGITTLDLQYNNGAPNAAGEIAADNLRAKGYTVLTNASVPSYDADFQAWIDYCTLQGYYMTSDTVKLDAANQYVLDSKADGTWYGKDVFHLFAWNDLQMDDASLVCLKRLIKVDVYGGMTYTVNGWEGNGVDGYISTNFIPDNNGVNFTIDNASYGYVTYKVPTSTYKYQIGNSTNRFFQFLTDESSNRQTINTSDLVSPNVDFSGLGLKSANRINSNDVVYYNKSSQSERTQISTTLYGSLEIYLFRTENRFTNGGQSYVFIGKGFTQTENESIRTNLNTYLTSIGLTPIA